MTTLFSIFALRGRDRDNPSWRGRSNENYEERMELMGGGHFPATSVCVVYQLCGRMRDNGSRPLPQGGCKQSDWRDILNTRDGSY